MSSPKVYSEEAIHQKVGKNERQELKQVARESAEFVRKGGDPRDLPKHLRIENM